MANTRFTVAGLALWLGGCSVAMEPASSTTLSQSATVKHAPVIVGQLNWVEAGSLPVNDPRRVAGRPVGLLWLPAAGARCTAFLVSTDVVMTNHHCVSTTAEAVGAYVVFDAEAGVPDSLRPTYDCSTFVGADADLDYALLRCQGQPGAVQGVVTLAEDAAARGDSIFVVHQNCDYYSDAACQPDKKISLGHVTAAGAVEYSHDADTLGGSSGSAMFDAQGRLIGLHHVGINGNASGRGSENRAVRLDRILPAVRQAHPGALDVTAPSTPAPVDSPPADPTRDTFEPNDDTGSATVVTLPFSADALSIAGNDRDLFRVTLTSAATLSVDMRFVHAAGDLDLYLFRAGGSAAVAESAGVTDVENISVALSAGTYFVLAVGYNGAGGAYALQIR